MFFDDRLATVLRQRAGSDVGLRTQFRQLLDILGAEKVSSRSARDPSLVATAWMRMDALGEKIPPRERAKMVRETGWRFRNPELAAHLADFEPDVASAALNRAELSPEDWAALIPRLPVRARGFLRLRKDLPVNVEVLLERLGVHDRGLPSPGGEAANAVDDVNAGFKPPPPVRIATDPPFGIDEDVPPPFDLPAELEPGPESAFQTPEPALDSDHLLDAASERRSEISVLVQRIAQFKRTREGESELDSSEPRLPLGEDQPRKGRMVSAFGFAADAAGRIEWADSEIAPMVIGARLVMPPRLGGGANESPLERAFSRRQPVTDVQMLLNGAEAIAGEWIVNAQPRFTDDGNFTGYVGRFRRPATADPAAPTAAEREADRLRQLLHELRTPVTAVQGYAEVIQQQLFGTAPHEYRALAAAIAADAARILAGFEELDRLAKMETGAEEIESGETDLAAMAARTCRQLDQVLHPRMAGIAIDGSDVPCIVPLDPEQAEAIIWRLLATLGGGCATGETLKASIVAEDDFAVLTCDLPAQLLSEEDIFAAEAKPIGTAINAGLFGAGFALRLARAEARAAGGSLLGGAEQVTLRVPLLNADADIETQFDADCGAGSDY